MNEITVATIVNLNNPDTLKIPNAWIKKLSKDHKFGILLKNNLLLQG